MAAQWADMDRYKYAELISALICLLMASCIPLLSMVGPPFLLFRVAW